MELESYLGEPDIARLRAVLKGKKVDRVPNLENGIDDQHVAKILGARPESAVVISEVPYVPSIISPIHKILTVPIPLSKVPSFIIWEPLTASSQCFVCRGTSKSDIVNTDLKPSSQETVIISCLQPDSRFGDLSEWGG